MGKSIFDTLKADSKEAAYRVAGTQIMKASKDGLLNVLRKRGIDNKHISAVSDFIDTEVGTALLSTCVGFTFSYIPPFKHDKRAKTLAKEFRVSGMALAGNILADKAIQDLLPAFNRVLDALPKLPSSNKQDKSAKIRIAESETVYEELEEQTSSNKESYKLDVWH